MDHRALHSLHSNLRNDGYSSYCNGVLLPVDWYCGDHDCHAKDAKNAKGDWNEMDAKDERDVHCVIHGHEDGKDANYERHCVRHHVHCGTQRMESLEVYATMRIQRDVPMMEGGCYERNAKGVVGASYEHGIGEEGEQVDYFLMIFQME